MIKARQTYCEGCGAAIPIHKETCPCCGIDKPEEPKYKSIVITPTSQTRQSQARKNTSRIYSSPGTKSFAASSEVGKPIKSGLNRFQANKPQAVNSEDSVYGKEVFINLDESQADCLIDKKELLQLVELYNEKQYRIVYDRIRLMKSNTRVWQYELLAIYALLRTIAVDPGIKTLTKHRKSFQRILDSLKAKNVIGSQVPEDALVMPAIYAAMIFAINQAGSHAQQHSEGKSYCTFQFGAMNKHLIEKLITYGEILHALYQQCRVESLSYTTIFICALAIKLDSNYFFGLDIENIQSYLRYHRDLCHSKPFNKITQMNGKSLGMTFWTGRLSISGAYPFHKMKTRRIGFRLGS